MLFYQSHTLLIHCLITI